MDDNELLKLCKRAKWPEATVTTRMRLAGEAVEAIPRLIERAQKAEKLCAEVRGSGVEFEDSRVHYLTVQIDRVTWNELAALAPDPQEGKPKEIEMETRKSIGRIVLYPGIVGDYEGAYDFINEAEWGRPENIPGYHEGGIGDHPFYVYEVVEIAQEASKSDE